MGSTIGEVSKNQGKGSRLIGKDFITLAIFSLLFFIAFFIFSMVIGMNASTFWYTHAVGSLVGGIVWMYIAAKVPKRGAFAIMSLIVAVVSLLLGMAGRVLWGLSWEVYLLN